MIPSDDPSPVRAWPVYAVTLALVPAVMLASATVIYVGAALLGLEPSVFGIEALVASVIVTSLVLAATAFMATMPGATPSLWSSLGLRPVRLAEVFFTVLGFLGFVAVLDGMVMLWSLDESGSLAEMRKVIGPLDRGPRMGVALIVGLFPGVCEELFFRGYAFGRLMSAKGPAYAVLMSALLFGLFHMDPVHSSLAFFMGIYLGVCMLYTGSLWATIAAHITNNILAVMWMDVSRSTPLSLAFIALGALVGSFGFMGLKRCAAKRCAFPSAMDSESTD